MASFKLRVRCTFKPDIPIIDFLTPETTLSDFFETLTSLTGCAKEELKVFYGKSKVIKKT